MIAETLTWEKLTPSFTGCPTPRAAHGMCAVGSKLVIFGGRDSVGRKNDLFILDMGEFLLSTVKPLLTPSAQQVVYALLPPPPPPSLVLHTKLAIMCQLKKKD